jgi:POT family proton-dependent oligopeptide transporter
MKLISLFKFVPEEVRELFFLKIFSTYSYAIFYASLVLYMTDNVGLSNQYATGVVGVFISLNFILHFFGGFAGGKLISNRMLLLIGMIMEFLGVSIISINLFLGLGIFLTGSGLYVTSINAIMIQKYEPNDSRRELASFWIYSGMNLGFFIGHTMSGYFHIQSNYQLLFFSAIAATFSSLILIGLNWDKFLDKTTELSRIPAYAHRRRLLSTMSFIPLIIYLVCYSLIYHSETSKLIMLLGGAIFCSTFLFAIKQPNQADKNKVLAFLILVIAALAFWSLFFVGPMGLTLFIKHYVNNEVMGITIPPQWYNNINTGLIVVGGPLLANWFKQKREQGVDLSFPLLFAIALLNIGGAYLILSLGIFLSGHANQVAMIWVVISYLLETTGELFLSPVGVAMIGKLAPKGKQGLLLGLWAMVSGVASIISKSLSQMMVIPQASSVASSGIQVYNHMFSLIGWGAVLVGLVLFVLVPFIKKLIDDEVPVDQPLKAELA